MKRRVHIPLTLQFVSYKTKDVINSNAQKLKKEWDVDPDRWRSLGIHKLMTIEEAKVRAKQLNAQDIVDIEEHKVLFNSFLQ